MNEKRDSDQPVDHGDGDDRAGAPAHAVIENVGQALSTGFLVGALMRANIPVAIGYDDDGDYLPYVKVYFETGAYAIIQMLPDDGPEEVNWT